MPRTPAEDPLVVDLSAENVAVDPASGEVTADITAADGEGHASTVATKVVVGDATLALRDGSTLYAGTAQSVPTDEADGLVAGGYAHYGKDETSK